MVISRLMYWILQRLRVDIFRFIFESMRSWCCWWRVLSCWWWCCWWCCGRCCHCHWVVSCASFSTQNEVVGSATTPPRQNQRNVHVRDTREPKLWTWEHKMSGVGRWFATKLEFLMNYARKFWNSIDDYKCWIEQTNTTAVGWVCRDIGSTHMDNENDAARRLYCYVSAV